MLKSGLEAYAMEHEGYPTTQQGLRVLVGESGRGEGGYVPPEAVVDTYGNPLVYTCEGGHFQITSLGADGRVGGEGSNADETFDSARAGTGGLSPPAPLPEAGRGGA
jgi:general secretion pathway protein G